MNRSVTVKKSAGARSAPLPEFGDLPLDELRATEILSHRFDRVYFTTYGRGAGRGARTEPFRAELVQRVRREIAAGTYLADERLNIAIDRLYDTWIRVMARAARKKVAG